MDEIDHLMSSTSDQKVLNQLFELANLPNSRLILIGIANVLDMTERFLHVCQSTSFPTSFSYSSFFIFFFQTLEQPMLLHFQRYQKDQIKLILVHKLQEYGDLFFEPAALTFIAGKVSNSSGDLRQALELCR